MVWAGICGNGFVIGPFFIAGSISEVKYHDLIVENIYPLLVERFQAQFDGESFRNLWWEQDGAPAHRKLYVREFLEEIFLTHMLLLAKEIMPGLLVCQT